MENTREKVDIMMYNGILDMSIGKIQRVSEELTPSFLINEALEYFSEREEFEKCHSIKRFFILNKDYVDHCTKEQWYGLTEKIA